MLSAKEAKDLALKGSRLEKILEDIEAAIIGLAEDGDFQLNYTINRDDFKYIKALQNSLTELGYRVHLENYCEGHLHSLDEYAISINWRMS